jgi:hypothetical protein
MRLLIEQFHGARPRREPRLLGQYEAQVAENCRLYSGALGSWRKPVDVQAIGTNSLKWSNQFDDALWVKTGLTSVVVNNTTAPDGSTTMDQLVESGATSQHGIRQSVAKNAVAENWAASCSFKQGTRSFAVIEISDGGGTNLAYAIVNIATGAILASAASGTFVLVSATAELEANSCARLHLVAKTDAGSVVSCFVGGALGTGVYSYAGGPSVTCVYTYGASLRKASKSGPYRETLAVALPKIDSIYLYKDQYWFSTSEPASFVKGPIPGDSTDAIYFTGGSAALPSVTYDPIAYNGGTGRGDMPRQAYTIGLPAPATAPTPTPQPPTGNVTSVINVIGSTGTQTTATFSINGLAVDGSRLVAQCNFNVLITTSSAKNITAIFKITRGTKIVAEAERKISLEFTGAVSETEEIDVFVSGEDSPPSGTYNYTFEVTITVGSGTIDTVTHNHTGAKVRYTTVQVGVGSGHPFVAGDRVTFAGVGGFESLNQSGLEVISTATSTIRVNVDKEEAYTSGGTWTKDFEESDKQDTAWLTTFLTQVGNQVQEGPPSIASTIVAIGPGQPVLLENIPVTPPSDGGVYNVTGKRIYRTNVSSSGDAAYQFVAEIPLAQASYTDSTLPDALGEVLPSLGWIKPPADMKGLIALPDGTMAGFSKNELCFCEPFQAHAWPTKYRLTVNFEPIGLAAFGASMLVCTRGKPAIVVGSEPGSQRLEYVEASQPCVSAKSIVDMGEFVVYAGDDGLVLVSIGSIRPITRELFKKEEWAELNPSTIIGAEYGGRYVGFYTKDDGSKAGFVFDPQEPSSSWVDLNFGTDVVWTDPKTGDLYVVVDETIARWNADFDENYAFRWRSRRYSMSTARNLAYAKVVAAAYPVRLTLYANIDPKDDEFMTAVHTAEVSDSEPFVLQGGDYLATSFEVEVSGHSIVKRVAIATSIEELNQAG